MTGKQWVGWIRETISLKEKDRNSRLFLALGVIEAQAEVEEARPDKIYYTPADVADILQMIADGER